MSVATKKSSRSRGTKSTHSSDGGVRQPVPSFHRATLSRKSDVRKLRRLSAPHVESYNYFLDVGLARKLGMELEMIESQSDRNEDWRQ